ncbi:hypothetical protein M885DRAFT_572120 [Pelagophyceae sp. CCMP2097]|nr:hypothetical protein M885DRAFT_572120 [Pelagophyceae sp. CCMP2097]
MPLFGVSGLKISKSERLTKPLGTGVLFAGDMRAMARAADVREALASMCLSNSKAAAVLRAHNCTACTDVTGFGLMGHLVEMCPMLARRGARCFGDGVARGGAAVRGRV